MSLIPVGMGKTIEVARDRANDPEKNVLPAEVARGTYIENPPSAQALKVLHYLIAVAGGDMADEVQHEFHLSDLKRIEGMRHHDRSTLSPIFLELSQSVLVHDDKEQKRLHIGGILDGAEVDYREEASGDLRVMWWFGRMFRRVAEESNLFAIIDRQTIFRMGSKYSILLFQHIASLVGKRATSQRFTVQELRQLMGVENSKLTSFGDFNRRALQPAIDEINGLSRLRLTASLKKKGRAVIAVEISWKDPDAPPEHPVANPNAFPTETVFGTRWQAIFDANKPRGVLIGTIGDNFRAYCAENQVPLDDPDIEALFVGWLKGGAA